MNLLPTLRQEYKLKFEDASRSIGSSLEFQHKSLKRDLPLSDPLREGNVSQELDEFSKKVINLMR